MRCESAVRAVTPEDLCLLHVRARSLRGAIQTPHPRRHPIHGLGGCGIPKTVTHPSTNRGGRCYAAREGSGVNLTA
jgi:hypothetical protein